MGMAFLHGRNAKKVPAPFAKLTVKCPAGVTVRLTSVNTATVFEMKADSEGNAICNRLTAGEWDITFANVDYAQPKRIKIDSLDYEIVFTYFNAVIDITYPAGSACSVTNGNTTLQAPDTSGGWRCTVSESGTWTVTVERTHDVFGLQTTSEDVNISVDGQFENVTLKYFESYINVSYPVGSICGVCDAENTNSWDVVDDGSGYHTFTIPREGSWIVQCIRLVDVDHQVDYEIITISDDGQVHDVVLSYFSVPVEVTYPVGSTCTATDGVNVLMAPDVSGEWTCDIPFTGSWTFSSTNGSRSDSKIIEITSTSGPTSVELAYFAATVNISYPAGSTCTITNDIDTYIAPDINGTWTFVADKAGEWIVASTDGEHTISSTVNLTDDGEVVDVVLTYLGSFINITYSVGASCSVWRRDPDDQSTYHWCQDAPDTSGKWTYLVPETGAYRIDVVLDIGNDNVTWEDEEIIEKYVTITGPNEIVDITMMLDKDRTYLLKNGDHCDDITGGWAGAMTTDGSTIFGGLDTGGNIWFELKSGGRPGYAVVYTNSQINLDGYSKLIAEISVEEVAQGSDSSVISLCGIGLLDEPMSTVTSSVVYEFPPVDDLLYMELDISSITGYQHVSVASQLVEFSVKKIYLI